MHRYILPVHRYIYRWTAKFTSAPVKYSGAPVIFIGPPVNFSGAPVFVMTLSQYHRTGITLTYHPIRSRLVSHSIQVLADSLFMRIQPSLRDRFFISWKHNVLFSIYFILSSEINAYQKQIKMISITSEMTSCYYQPIFSL